MEVDQGRRAHFGDFYDSARTAARGDLLLVHGNCQAESLRIVLQGDDVRAVRIPPVHELVAADVPHLRRLLGATRHLVTQPVRDDYRGLPIGTGQLVAALPAGATTVVVPVVRVAGLYPTHVLVRPTSEPGLSPPVVPYHDLRTVLTASDPAQGRWTPTPSQVLAVAAASQGELRRREEAHGTVVASDLIDRPTFADARTLNHPGNPVWRELAHRVRERLGLVPTWADPGRPLLDHLHAPRLAAVRDAFGLDVEPTDHWVVGGQGVPDEDVTRAHLAWYAEHPDVVAQALERHRPTLALLERA
ncbi:WcbI family polysaccharide biosynthesis putative acetyltransferase [Solicola sp. PLA-1-18]|uniref:WcbI family polysaccharide biosynthesis putative acetyltransferase n=1 Tax=Solicola sp. PLA-1-18 TaxID=3380532 RepID=UPI003B76EA01